MNKISSLWVTLFITRKILLFHREERLNIINPFKNLKLKLMHLISWFESLQNPSLRFQPNPLYSGYSPGSDPTLQTLYSGKQNLNINYSRYRGIVFKKTHSLNFFLIPHRSLIRLHVGLRPQYIETLITKGTLP